MARGLAPGARADTPLDELHSREELRAIDAIIAGQGVGICSDVLVGRDLETGALVKAFDLAFPGLGFYLVHVPNPPRPAVIAAFAGRRQTQCLVRGKQGSCRRRGRTPPSDQRGDQRPRLEGKGRSLRRPDIKAALGHGDQFRPPRPK
jgi:hypothetical protein